jgi:C4-dicarboxylate-specific signal transduction histidine kinase
MRKELSLNRSSRRTSAVKDSLKRNRARKAPAARALQEASAADAQTQRLASLGFMVASVCHEVSNPLSAIYSMVQILQSKRGVTAETVEKGLASIAGNIARVLAITRKLGDFSRVTGEPAPVAIDAAVDAALSLLRHSACGAAVEVVRRGAPGASVLARPGEIEQILFNVLLNAAQAMGGAGRIELDAGASDGTAIVQLRDSGPGIAPEHLKRVFEPFFTTKQPGEGTGLGLAIAYEVAHEMGGTIRASNHPLGGALFEIRLPAWRG